MVIKNYGNLDEKETKFTSYKIDNKEDLDKFIKKFSNKSDKNYFFRGCNEAKYKLFASGQRAWSTYEISNVKPTISYLDFLKAQVKYALYANKKVLKNFYKSIGITPYSITVLSFLQHYGGNTPLLDFTLDINIALYFATENIQVKPSLDIDNYFSIYIIGENEMESFDGLLGEGLTNPRNKGDTNKNTLIENIIERSMPFYVKWGLHSLSANSKGKPFIIEIKRQNLNIINQKGLFVFNPDDSKPLEETLIHKKIICYNIHKSLSEYVKSKIRITKGFVYPQEEEIAKMAISSFLTNSI